VTSNEEWYDPRAVTTGGGALAITFTQGENHELGFTGGMIQSWNKFCFTGGLLEASVMMPNRADLFGMWPAVWTMGNLGRAGYAATTDGLVSVCRLLTDWLYSRILQWPYSYDACDVGTLPGQNLNGVPAEAMSGNNDDKTAKGAVSLLPGQRLSACTCPADAAMHPGPRRKDGTFAGRSAPEIDVFEQQGGSFKKPPYKGDLPEISQSAQFAVCADWIRLNCADDGYSRLTSNTSGRILRSQAPSELITAHILYRTVI
jgi:beta-glucanase (GH16 family)